MAVIRHVQFCLKELNGFEKHSCTFSQRSFKIETDPLNVSVLVSKTKLICNKRKTNKVWLYVTITR